MTVSLAPSLPAEPPAAWTKPTLGNTKGGKLYTPTHPGLFRVEFTSNLGSGSGGGAGGEEESFSSRLVAERNFAPGEVITPLTNISLAPAKAYSSVQFGKGAEDHLELNSDLLFMNHSCAPTAYLELPSPSHAHARHAHAQAAWLVRAGPGGIASGGDITFFYPSTEWDMAQGFECGCGAGAACLGRIQGAKHLSLAQLEQRGYVNQHIRELKADQEQERA